MTRTASGCASRRYRSGYATGQQRTGRCDRWLPDRSSARDCGGRHGALAVRPTIPVITGRVTTGGHVIYESRLELARLLLADFDPDVIAIAARPFLLRAGERPGAPSRADFLLIRADQTVRVVNVKPAARWPIPRWPRRWPGRVNCSRPAAGGMRSGPARSGSGPPQAPAARIARMS